MGTARAAVPNIQRRKAMAPTARFTLIGLFPSSAQKVSVLPHTELHRVKWVKPELHIRQSQHHQSSPTPRTASADSHASGSYSDLEWHTYTLPQSASLQPPPQWTVIRCLTRFL
ncbi:hypothetical protein, unlikely [Trypanosoma brucei gambiense DAL972]|uniref:Uncharacterized protein n=1 Tax=Trypanosoma brucei gambiense (strain MHOM/CI/86/DAL972) TaxID=679716 RepID=C9ZU29_TRYB9|nr:hypothetical protein, unlikely [Trypanosoma brucei gambiense DAL972]CBH12915.1 hypothetical protein, unlikely [Trypanosoma brucei gambiense DAL972]|eukprot:XP_011775194.1 hypothetical protein, unlikely [Trypanosoma brucei gambiense DAL972]